MPSISAHDFILCLGFQAPWKCRLCISRLIWLWKRLAHCHLVLLDDNKDDKVQIPHSGIPDLPTPQTTPIPTPQCLIQQPSWLTCPGHLISMIYLKLFPHLYIPFPFFLSLSNQIQPVFGRSALLLFLMISFPIACARKIFHLCSPLILYFNRTWI